jgi:hypothetical protein
MRLFLLNLKTKSVQAATNSSWQFLVLIIILLLNFQVIAQERTHKGFYLSMQFGPAFGSVYGFDPAGERLTISGTGFGFDLLLGGTLTENLILHGTLSSKLKSAPTINAVECSECIAFDESFIGAGLTYYLKHNFLLSGSVGSGSFTLSNDISNINYPFWDSSLPEYCTEPYTTFSTREGFTYQLKAGKEWWMSARWAMGILFEYSSTIVPEPFKDQTIGQWSSNRFTIRASFTRHGKKNKE